MTPAPLTVEQCAALACLLEATASKAGNVHRGADFADMRFEHFLLSAAAIGPAMREAAERPLGETVLNAIVATQQLVELNTNLGIVLLLAPLAAVPPSETLRDGLAGVLDKLTPADAANVYAAIRLAHPGGLGEVDEMDVHDAPPADLLAAMHAAADRDSIARQYATGFADLFDTIAPWLAAAVNDLKLPISSAVTCVHVQTMHAFPDSLIARKGGLALAAEAAARAGHVLEAGDPRSEEYHRRLGDLDFWLRSDGGRRNPGTSADLLAAALFIVLRERLIPLPLPIL